MVEWQQRVVDEKAELDGRLERLRAFMASKAYQSLDHWTRDLMGRQEVLMNALSRVLGQRIEIFRSPFIVKPSPAREA